MKEKITFISDDGEEFETREDCLAYEKAQTELSGLLGFNGDMEFQDPKEIGVEDAFQISRLLFITDADSAEESFRIIEDRYGVEVPTQVMTGDIRLYDFDTDTWADPVSAYIQQTEQMCEYLRGIRCWIPRDKAEVLHETAQKIRSAIADSMKEMEAL